MAYLLSPFNSSNPTDIIEVTRSHEDIIPAHVKGIIYFHYNTQSDHNTDYHLPILDSYFPPKVVGFLNNYWYKLFDHEGVWYTSLSDCITPNTLETGYWHITNPQHPNYQPVTSTSTLAIGIPIATFTADPTVSSFITAQPINWAQWHFYKHTRHRVTWRKTSSPFTP